MVRSYLLLVEQGEGCIQDFVFLSHVLEGITYVPLEKAVNTFLFLFIQSVRPICICSCLYKRTVERPRQETRKSDRL